MRETREKNDGWQQTLRNGTTKGRSGKLVASCSRRWNSSAHSCEFCEQHNSAIGVSDGTAARPSQTDATGATSPYPGPASSPSPPDPVPPSLLTLTSRASADRRTDGAAENNQMGSSAGRLSSIVSTAKKKHMRRHVVVDVLPNPLTPTDKRMNGRTDGRPGG